MLCGFAGCGVGVAVGYVKLFACGGTVNFC